ncbi:apoptosis-inducing factor 3 [Sardina pilchardus]|uniref:apoptosis-inducing factor 3 n=1 Tax=Sardina pilchardus TaxID=27697 RepID=UPI002E151EF7
MDIIPMQKGQTNPVPDVDPEEPEEVTEAVCLESELQDGQMMEVEVGHHNVLLARCEGVYHAVGNQCTHYGAPLSKGYLGDHRVRCPWHGSCFDLKTGDLEEFPAMDCLPTHKVKVENSKVYVSINKKSLEQNKRLKSMGSRVPGVSHTVLLLGGGCASLVCAETLRQEKYGGRIIMVTRDDLLPYDKTRLSKVMNVESDSILLRRMEFFHQYDIEMWLRKEALSINTDKKTVTFNDGITQCYDQLLIATGCRAKGLECPGSDLENILMLQILEEKGVTFYMNDSVTEIRGEDKKVKEIILKSGTVIPADILIVGIGVIPNSEVLQGSNVTMDAKNFVPVDKYMRTNIKDVFCAGDLSTFPLKMAKDQKVNIGHWQLAQAHGRVAALNMLNKEVEFDSVPFYWTVLLGMTIRYTGFGEGYTDLVLKGKVEHSKFLALYIKDDKVVAAAGLNFDPAVSVVAERLATGKTISKAEAESDDLSWLHLPDLNLS